MNEVIRRLTTDDIEKARELWQLRFHDDDNFLNWYFSRRFDPSLSFGLFMDDELISMSHGFGMKLKLRQRVFPALMVSGISTREGYERHGYMHRVVSKQLKYALSLGFALSFCHPEDIHAYDKLGFSVCSDIKLVKGFRPSPLCGALSAEAPSSDLSSFASRYAKLSKPYSFITERDESACALRLEDVMSDGGRLFSTDNGCCFYHRSGETLHVDECICDSDYESFLAALVQSESGSLVIDGKFPVDCKLTEATAPWTVMVALDVPRLLLELVGDPNQSFEITDSLTCSGAYSGMGLPVQHGCVQISVNRLSSALCGYHGLSDILCPVPCYCPDEY